MDSPRSAAGTTQLVRVPYNVSWYSIYACGSVGLLWKASTRQACCLAVLGEPSATGHPNFALGTRFLCLPWRVKVRFRCRLLAVALVLSLTVVQTALVSLVCTGVFQHF